LRNFIALSFVSDGKFSVLDQKFAPHKTSPVVIDSATGEVFADVQTNVGKSNFNADVKFSRLDLFHKSFWRELKLAKTLTIKNLKTDL